MRVWITGTSGFIGRALAENMAVEHEVVCLSRQPTAVDGVEKIAGSFTAPAVLARRDGRSVLRRRVRGRLPVHPRGGSGA